jgi:hypothetical protein
MKAKITPAAWVATALLFIGLINIVFGVVNVIRLIWWYDDVILKIFIIQIIIFFGFGYCFKVLGNILKDEKEKAYALKVMEKTSELIRKNEKYGI